MHNLLIINKQKAVCREGDTFVIICQYSIEIKIVSSIVSDI